MTSARAFWYPSSTSFQVTAIGTPFSDLQELEQRQEIVLDSASGHRRNVHLFGNRAVTVISQRMASPSLGSELEGLQNHIASRNVIGVCESEFATLAGWSMSALAPGNLSISFTNLWAYWGTVDVAAGDRFVLVDPYTYTREEVTADAWDGYTLTLSTPVKANYGKAFVRHKSFHPYLRLRSGGVAMVTHDRRATWDLNLPMEEPPLSPPGTPPGPGDLYAGAGEGIEFAPSGQYLHLYGALKTYWGLR